jgi:multidrug resistance protein, MATE family
MSTYRMTRFPPGSLRELVSISFPLMLTAFSGNLMIFCDRAILAKYSVDAMTAAFASSFVFAMFAFFGVGVASIAEVFVGQYNGKKEFDKLAVPVWQMIWFSLLFSLPMIPVAIFGANLFLPNSLIEEGRNYFQIVMIGAFFMPLISAVSSFFIGQGRTKMVTAAAIIGNVINLILDIVLINGIDGLVAPLGAAGAAIATVISMCLQFLILFFLFWSKENNKKYKTRKYSIDVGVFKECMKIGLPVAFSLTLEIAGWSALNIALCNANKNFLTAQSIGSAFFILFAFFSDGLNKAVTAIASNFIGAKHKALIKKLLKSSLILHLGMVSLLFILLILVPEVTLNMFLDANATKEEVKALTLITMKGTFYFFLFDGLAWIIAAVLRAGGDTRFVMICNITFAWIAVLASYLVLSNNHSDVRFIFLYIIPSYAIMNLIVLFYRYLSNKWLELKVDDLT